VVRKSELTVLEGPQTRQRAKRLDSFLGIIVSPDSHKWLYFYTCPGRRLKKSRFSTWRVSRKSCGYTSWAKSVPTPEHLRRLYQRGLLVRMGRGVYMLPNASTSANFSLAEVAKKVPRGIGAG